MTPFRSEVIIRRPADQVFAYVADPRNYSKWMEGVTGAQSGGGSLHSGAPVHMQGRVAMWKLDGPMQLTAYEPPRVFGLQGTVGPLFFDGKWEFEPRGSAETRVTVTGAFEMAGIWRLLEPLLAGEVRNGEAKELVKIKEQLEGTL
jgi:uncharacterized protein YndB with AHSA1/START domain